MKNKNANMRYRFLKSLNWVQVYQQPNVAKIYNSYFDSSKRSYFSVKKNAIKLLKDRIRLDKWPLTNFDLMSVASTITQIKLIKYITKSKVC